MIEEKLAEELVGKCETVSDFWGSQMPMNAMEEMAELIQAISKFERSFVDGKEPNLNIYQMRKGAIVIEIADVWIATIALMHYYDIDLGIIVEKMSEKLEKKY